MIGHKWTKIHVLPNRSTNELNQHTFVNIQPKTIFVREKRKKKKKKKTKQNKTKQNKKTNKTVSALKFG